jgi:hypothetical protein
MSPPSCRGDLRRSTVGPQVAGTNPPAMTAAAPSAGASAAVPGKGVEAPNATAAPTMVAKPAQAVVAWAARGSRLSHGAPSASKPPRASSHARDGSEKNAHGSSARVSQREKPNDEATTMPSAAIAQDREGDRCRAGVRRRTTPLASTRSSGQRR